MILGSRNSLSIGDIIPKSGCDYIVYLTIVALETTLSLHMTTIILTQKLGVQVVDKDLLYPRLGKAVLSV